MISDNVMTALFVAIPATITSIGAAIVAVKQSNKASARTDEHVEAVKQVIADNTDKLGQVHETVNGNFTVVSDDLKQAREENAGLREELARHKSGKRSKSAP